MVSYDNEQTFAYLSQYNGISLYKMDKNAVMAETDISDPKTGGRFIYNKYLNHLVNNISDGFVIVLDDDDYFTDANTLQHIASKIYLDTDMILWQFQYPSRLIVPSIHEVGMRPKQCRISNQCIAVHHTIAKKSRWDGWKVGDFRYISRCWDLCKDRKWVGRPLVQLGSEGGGLGKQGDIGDMKLRDYFKTTRFLNPLVNSILPQPYQPVVQLETSVIEENKQSNKTVSDKPYSDIIIGISTFNRYDKLCQLIDSLNRNKTFFSVKIIVNDDASTEQGYSNLTEKYPNIIYNRTKQNNGKKRYWETINQLFKTVNAFDFKWFFQLDDDIEICDRFLEIAVSQTQKHKSLTLNLSIEKGHYKEKGRWGYGKYVDGNSVYTEKAIKLLNYSIFPIHDSRWQFDKALSSGVWQQVTERMHLVRYANPIQFSDQSLINHKSDVAYASKMNILRKNHDDMITTDFKPFKKMEVIMCTWKRSERFLKTLQMLNTQTNQSFNLNVWNNNKEIVQHIESVTVSKKWAFDILLHHSNKNIGGFARFDYASKIVESSPDKIIVFIDDDQDFDNNFIQKCYDNFEKKTIKSQWAWQIKKTYFDRERVLNNNPADYVGTCGMVLDGEVFLNKKLWDLPKEYWFIEDLWLSYFAKYECGYQLKGITLPIKSITDGKDQYVKLIPKKEEFYQFLLKKYKK